MRLNRRWLHKTRRARFLCKVNLDYVNRAPDGGRGTPEQNPLTVSGQNGRRKFHAQHRTNATGWKGQYLPVHLAYLPVSNISGTAFVPEQQITMASGSL